MFTHIKRRQLTGAVLLSLATACASLTLGQVTPASANACPADKAGSNLLTSGPDKPVGVTDNVLTSIDLSKEMVDAKDHQFRMRRLTVQPGGIVPWHDHADRPAIIYIVEGEITEYASDCAVPILHKAGDVARDADLKHWWKNTGKKPVVLISADILHNAADKNM
jgi:quercetin dioxygenase-like cupin family protein